MALAAFLIAQPASAQVGPPQPSTPPDDTPAIRIGAVVYADYTYQTNPTATDADGNTIDPNSFNVTRSYLNVTGNISHVIAFRVTPDIVRPGADAGATLNGSNLFRIKYAFIQFNLDDWVGRGSWTRLGIQQTPWVDFQEGIYRYRFQGTVFSEREAAAAGGGYLTSSDAGASFHYNFPSNFGDVHVGYYNGDKYNVAEANDQKAWQVRATVRPFATGSPALRVLRAHVFYDGDAYIKDGERRRFIASATYEHPNVIASFEYLDTTDQTSGLPAADAPCPSGVTVACHLEGKGYSFWVNPKQATNGWEALLRYDHMQPNKTIDGQERHRGIVGVSYWFPHQGTVQAALLVDYDAYTFRGFPGAPAYQERVAVHGQIIF
jgi:hypothetical protein